MARLPAPERSACPKCGCDLRGEQLEGVEFVCPKCDLRSKFWALAPLGGRPRWLTPVICIGWGACAVALSVAAFFVVGRWTLVVYALAMLSDAPTGPLPPMHLYLMGIIALPVLLSGIPVFLSLRKSYRAFGWSDQIRRARWRTVQTVLTELVVVALVVVGTVLYLWRN